MRKYLIQLQLAFLAAFIVALWGCSKNNPAAPSVAPSQGKMTFQLAAVANIVSGSVTITKNETVVNKTVAMANNTGSVQFDGIEVGTWNVAVKLMDAAGVEIYSGSSTAVVNKDVTTPLNVLVSAHTGNLLITVGVATPTPTPIPTLIYEDFEATRPPISGPWTFMQTQPQGGYKSLAIGGTDISSPAGSWVMSATVLGGTLYILQYTWESFSGEDPTPIGLRDYTNAKRFSIWVKLNPQYNTHGVVRPYVYATLAQHDSSRYVQNIYGNPVQITSGEWVRVSMELKDFHGDVSGNLVPYPLYLRETGGMGVELSTPNGGATMLEVDGFRLE